MPRAHIRLALALGLGGWTLVPQVYALDPSSAGSQYVVRRWDAHSALPSNSIHAFVQTRDHYLWMGTSAGLVRFDGTRFVSFDAQNTPVIREGGVSSLAPTADGGLCVGTKSGAVACYDGRRFTTLELPVVGNGRIASLFAASDGSLWIGASGRALYQAQGGAVREHRPFDVTAPSAIAEDRTRKVVWLGTRGQGLLRYDGRTFTRYSTDDGLASNTVQAVHVDRAGTLWVGTLAGVCALRDATFSCFGTADGLSHDSVTALAEDRDGNLWIGTGGGGVNRLYRGRFTRLTTRDRLSDDDVRCLLEDHEGNLWVGTADGLNEISDGRFLSFGRDEGLHDTAVRAVLEARDGSVWIGTSGAGLERLRDGRVVEHHPLPDGGGTEGIIALHEARDGSVWIGTDGARLFRLQNGRLTDETMPAATAAQKVSVIVEDERGPIFHICGVGLVRKVDGRFVPLHPGAPLLGYLYSSFTDSQGTSWFGGSEGLVRVRGGEYKVWAEADGLPSRHVRWITEDADAAPDAERGLWVATYGGLAYVKNGAVRTVTVADGLPEGYLRLVLDDRLGHLWIATMSSIYRIDKRDIQDLFAGRACRVAAVPFDASDGLRSTEILLGSHPGFRAHDGRLWFATAKGVAVVDPARVRVDGPAPPVMVEAVSVDGQPMAFSSGVTLEVPPGRGEVKVDYAASSFASSRKMRFRYRLDGFDRDWVDAGSGHSAYYSSLPPGPYSLRVMASNRDGLWTGVPTVVSFHIRPPFTRAPWFYAVCAAAVALAFAGLYSLRVAQMRARFAAILGERTRIARELHDTMAQGLAGVSIQIETALRKNEEPLVARRHMQLARAMVRSSLAEVRRSIWVLRAQTSKGRNWLGAALTDSLAQLTEGTDVKTRMNVSGRPRTLDAEVERHLLRIAHEAVTNAVRHADASRIEVDLRFGADTVDLCVRDDGRGFDPDARLNRSQGHHFGLVGISERAQAMGGHVRIESRPGWGTEVTCRLPCDCRMVDPLDAMESGRNEEGASL
jgi:signal transduction histidine kinase/ligand-binding sensor domain-containing protein